jgi:outer membrane cobalamin receptor
MSYRLFWLAFFFLLSRICFASDDETPDEEEVVVTAPRLETTRNWPSAVVTTVNAKDLGSGLITLTSMAQAVPDLRLREFGGIGQAATLGVRGTAPNQTQVQIDGVPLLDPLGTGIDLSMFPTAFVERMEILRGAASFLAGSGALGGIVNLVTRSEKENARFCRLSGGSFGTLQGSAGSSFGTSRNRFLIALGGLTTRGDFTYTDDRQTPSNPFDDRLATRQNNDVLQGGILLKATTTIGEDATLSLTHQSAASDRGVSGLLGFTSQTAREQTAFLLFDVRGKLPFQKALFLMDATLSFVRHRFWDSAGELTGTPTDDLQKEIGLHASASAIVTFLDRQIGRLTIDGTQSSFFDPAWNDPQRTNFGSLLSAEIRLLKNQLCLVPAVRLDVFSDAGWKLSPAVGARLDLDTRSILRFNLSRAFRVPSFSELYLDSGYVVGNPLLRPESGIATDIGIETLFWEKIKTAWTIFYSRYQDLIVFEPGSNFRYRPQNIGSAELSGLEVEISGSPVRELLLMAHYTLLISRDRSGLPNRDGNELPGRPRHTAGARSVGRIQKCILEADATFVGPNFINEANTKELPSRLLLGAGIGIQASQAVAILLQAKNLLNTHIEDIRGMPLPGIAFFLTLSTCSIGETHEGTSVVR